MSLNNPTLEGHVKLYIFFIKSSRKYKEQQIYIFVKDRHYISKACNKNTYIYINAFFLSVMVTMFCYRQIIINHNSRREKERMHKSLLLQQR